MLLKSDPIGQRRTRFDYVEHTDEALVISEQEVRPVLEANHEMRRHWDHNQRMGEYGTLVGKIPVVLWDQLVRDGVAFDDEAVLTWLELPENAAWKLHPGRFARRRGRRVQV